MIFVIFSLLIILLSINKMISSLIHILFKFSLWNYFANRMYTKSSNVGKCKLATLTLAVETGQKVTFLPIFIDLWACDKQKTVLVCILEWKYHTRSFLGREIALDLRSRAISRPRKLLVWYFHSKCTLMRFSYCIS